MKDQEALSPPRPSGISDPGAHDLASTSDSEDHFSDAQSAPLSPKASPIPKTRVEKVDDEPSYGEVPGTEAYRMREGDAEPDEIAIQEKKSDASSDIAPKSPIIPKTVVEEAPGSSGPHSEEFLEKRKADAPADLVVKPDSETEEGASSAPPPLAPPDWIRSRIRRLFLVSLGVPVDLDEILPASKQKKLVLPSLQVHTSSSPRNSSDSRSVSRVRQSEANASSTSVDSQGKSSASKKKKGLAPVPDLDLVSAKQLCTTTEEALNGMTDEELKDHVAKLQAMEGIAKEVLEYWTKKTDEKIGDREAFEGVIENLVKHARKVRK
ncbi:Uncharacterized protein C8E11.05c [Colletotrichum chlorophyti]|uniref:Uncharacterized protein C8E11.05c n=1 Tax=Colletotrichum chlorophyti TaxID=708187 RepID=A0A1Q8RVZ5_9PEZI|nr:Uncharacterized protein C8E11.05c [Colletotrichum chlorophyti]